jgi:phosphoribosylanthranilate isomerase
MGTERKTMKKPGARVRIKICGTTRLEDALAAIDAGADALGFIFYRKSPRNVSMRTARGIIAWLPPFVETVGVFVDESIERVNRVTGYCGLDRVQLHGGESAAYCRQVRRPVIKGVRVKDERSLAGLKAFRVSGFLLDAYQEGKPGGTGKTFNWDLALAARAFGPLILAGGLDAGNVAEAIRRVRPYGVDVVSGVEASPGVKDAKKIRAFVQAVQGA